MLKRVLQISVFSIFACLSFEVSATLKGFTTPLALKSQLIPHQCVLAQSKHHMLFHRNVRQYKQSAAKTVRSSAIFSMGSHDLLVFHFVVLFKLYLTKCQHRPGSMFLVNIDLQYIDVSGV